MAITENSGNINVPAVKATHTAGGAAVEGDSPSGTGVRGESITADAVAGVSQRGRGVSANASGSAPAAEFVNDAAGDNAGPGLRARSRAAGVIGESTEWMGVYGLSQSSTGGHGVMGQSLGAGAGLAADSLTGPGLLSLAHGAGPAAECVNDDETDAAGPGLLARSRGSGVIGLSSTWMGVFGESESRTGGHGVLGRNRGSGVGVAGEATEGAGVYGESTGESNSAAGVRGLARGGGPGVWGESQQSGPGVLGRGVRDAGVWAIHGDPRLQETTVGSDGTHAGVFAASEEGAGVVAYARNVQAPAIIAFGGIRAAPMNRPFAGEFLGSVQVHGDVLLTGADCAERFELYDDAEPGDVVVLEAGGNVRRSRDAYDRTVAGVISGAGALRPGIVLNSQQIQQSVPVALVGRVFCRVDARDHAVSVGDLLTTSDTPGHAMVAADASRAFGSVLGKALAPMAGGLGLIPVLVCLQ
jgi:hypothetical protein